MIDKYLREDINTWFNVAFRDEDRASCAWYRGVGICCFGCWEEPTCQVDEPVGGWEYQAGREWQSNAETLRALAAEHRGDHRAVKHLRDLARRAGRMAVRLLQCHNGDDQ